MRTAISYPAVRRCEGVAAAATTPAAPPPTPLRQRPDGPLDLPPPRLSNRAGDVVKVVLAKMGYTSAGNCGCRRMQRQMNEWGWWRCWMQRRELVECFAAKAADVGVAIDKTTITAMLVAAWREPRKAR